MTKRHPMLERVIDHDARAAGWDAGTLARYTGVHYSSWGHWMKAPDQPVSAEAAATLTLVLALREQLDRCRAAMAQCEDDARAYHATVEALEQRVADLIGEKQDD